MKTVVILIIDIYRQLLSFDRGLFSFLAPGGACRHQPTCSLYTRQMVERYGVVKGLKLGLQRIISCR